MNAKSLSKYLSLILRHNPALLGIPLDEGGWAEIRTLLKLMNEKGMKVSLESLQEMVETNDKQRFAISEDGFRIRANQGHSLAVSLGLQPVTPPEILYHGTTDKYIESIREKGLLKMSRQHVHLSATKDTALKVGSRHGKPLIINVLSEKMHQSGYPFYLSENGVWLVDSVPAEFLEFPDS